MVSERKLLTGGCFCGEVRYAVDASDAADACVCHCATCRRTTGAPMVAWFSVKPEAFRFTAGAPVRFASSETGERQFCGRCGAQITFQNRSIDEIDITTASLDDPAAIPPIDQIWVKSRLDWMAGLHALPEFPRGHRAAPASPS
jgi:hypothetical protein